MIRVFPRKTKATPDDAKVYFTGPPIADLADKLVHVSCTFTYDRGRAEALAAQWRARGYDVKVGGPAYGDRGGEFVPGRYLKPGNVFTSRGCNKNCWFCKVHDREGDIRELPIVDGWKVQDSNLLQCSDEHVRAVFQMLERQPEKPYFTGGLDASELRTWHAEELRRIKTEGMYFAYDDPADLEPLKAAAEKIWAAGFSRKRHNVACYILIGYPRDTFDAAKKRIAQVIDLGLTPFAMLYRNESGDVSPDWVSFQAHWANPTKIYGSKKKNKNQLKLF